jgi:hypothetical protein
MTKTVLDQARLKELLDYDPLTGVFTWKPRPGARKSLNTRLDRRVAGYVSVRKDGYIRSMICVDRGRYFAARLAWLYMTGAFPEGHIDHINHDSTDNRWANLREVSSVENSRNMSRSRSNKSGVTGVSWDKGTGKWFVCIMVDGKTRYGGIFTSIEEAAAKRKELEQKYNFHPNHGAITNATTC